MSIKNIQNINISELEQFIPKSIISWVLDHVRRPIAGFESKRNPDGSYYSYDQQLQATYMQVLYVAHYWVTLGKPKEEIINSLCAFTEDY